MQRTELHLRLGWLWLAIFVAAGLGLEALHGMKVGAYLDLSQAPRRHMWTLGHAHGSLIGLVHLGLAAPRPEYVVAPPSGPSADPPPPPIVAPPPPADPSPVNMTPTSTPTEPIASVLGQVPAAVSANYLLSISADRNALTIDPRPRPAVRAARATRGGFSAVDSENGGKIIPLAGAVRFTRQHHGKVAVMGFCMGGALALAAAVHLEDLAAAVCFYGIPPEQLADPSKLRVPLLAHFADHDDWCTPDRVHALETQLRHATAEYELHRYSAQHAFFNEARPEVYDPQAATTAWRRTLAFLDRHIGVRTDTTNTAD